MPPIVAKELMFTRGVWEFYWNKCGWSKYYDKDSKGRDGRDKNRSSMLDTVDRINSFDKFDESVHHKYIGDNIQISVDISEYDFKFEEEDTLTGVEVEEEREDESDDFMWLLITTLLRNNPSQYCSEWLTKLLISDTGRNAKNIKGKAIISSNVIKLSSDTTLYTPGMWHANSDKRMENDILENISNFVETSIQGVCSDILLCQP